jgi:hypothetical protein
MRHNSAYRASSGRERVARRSALIVALATAGACASAAVALAAAHSTMTMDFSPSALPPPGTGYATGKLSVHTHTTYSKPGSANGGATQRGQIYFDDDIKFDTNAVPKCNPLDIDGNTTLQQAMAACGSSLVGKGTVMAIAPNSLPDPGDNSFFINGCVRIFNGQGSTSEILLFVRSQVSNPSNINCSTNGNQGTVSTLLHSDLTANPSSAGADFVDPDNCSAPSRLGCQLDVNNITTATPFPQVELNLNFQQASFLTARCDDTPQQLNLRTIFTYNNATTQTLNASKACS